MKKELQFKDQVGIIAGAASGLGLALFVRLGITVSSLKESDEEIFKYLTIPTLMLGLGIYLIIKGNKLRSR